MDSEVIVTQQNNRIARGAHIVGSEHIVISGDTLVLSGCTLRGDLTRSTVAAQSSIVLGRRCVLMQGCTLRPPYKAPPSRSSVFLPPQGHLQMSAPLTLGDSVVVGEGTVVEAKSIGSNVLVGNGCVLGPGCTIGSDVLVHPNTVVPALAHVHSCSEVDGSSIQQLDEAEVADLRRTIREAYSSALVQMGGEAP